MREYQHDLGRAHLAPIDASKSALEGRWNECVRGRDAEGDARGYRVECAAAAVTSRKTGASVS